MKKIIIFGCLSILIVAGLISTTVFAVLYINAQNDIKVKTAELALCQTNAETNAKGCASVTPTTTTPDKPTITVATFKDAGLGITVTYPTTWTGVLTTDISNTFSYDPYGRVVTKYEFDVTKSGVSLKFNKLLGALDGFPSGLKAATSDWVVIPGTNILRYSDKNANQWNYVSKVECSTLAEGGFATAAEIASYGVCIGSFFPGFGNLGANAVSINSADAAILLEADDIAKSALN